MMIDELRSMPSGERARDTYNGFPQFEILLECNFSTSWEHSDSREGSTSKAFSHPNTFKHASSVVAASRLPQH